MSSSSIYWRLRESTFEMFDLLHALAIAIVFNKFCYFLIFNRIIQLYLPIFIFVSLIFFFNTIAISYSLLIFDSIFSIIYRPSSSSYLYFSKAFENYFYIWKSFFSYNSISDLGFYFFFSIWYLSNCVKSHYFFAKSGKSWNGDSISSYY